MQELWKTAEQSLNENRVQTRSGPITVAGGHHFKTFWVRDFCLAVPGLLLIGARDQVRGQIEICLKHQRADGLLARGFDVVNPKLRVVGSTFGIPGLKDFDYSKSDLRPEYLGEHGTPSVDSNLLILWACLRWQSNAGDDFFTRVYGDSLKKAFEFVLRSKQNGLLRQPAFSDWQDSARREGETFYFNLLFVRVLTALQKAGVAWADSENLDSWRNLLWTRFFDTRTGLFRDQPQVDRYSMETQLWCIEDNLFASEISRAELWASLKKSDLWNPWPGRPVTPQYPARDISWTTKLVGLRHYHDGFYWSWLMGESLKISAIMQDATEKDRLLAELTRLARTYGTIHEVYELRQSLQPVARAFYRSEFPFSWGAGKIIEALHACQST